MTTGEVARALGVATTTVQRWVKRYGLRPAQTTPGGHMRWDFDDLKVQLRNLSDFDES